MPDLITVIIPAYNAAATLDRTLVSVRSQSYRDVEILIIDDGSGDQTSEIARRHAAADSRVRLISQANAEVALQQENRGIAEARGTLIAPIDADEIWTSTKLEKQSAMMAQGEPKVGLVYCWYAIIDAEDLLSKASLSLPLLERCSRNFARTTSLAMAAHPSYARIRYKRPEDIAHSFALLARKAARIGFCTLRIAEKFEFQVVEECLLGYRMVPGSMSRDGRQMLRSMRQVTCQILKRNPDLSQNLATGDFNLSTWLFRRAVSGFNLSNAAYLTAVVSIRHPMRFVLSFIPEAVQLSLAALSRWVRHPPKDRFTIGSVSEDRGVRARCPPSTSDA